MKWAAAKSNPLAERIPRRVSLDVKNHLLSASEPHPPHNGPPHCGNVKRSTCRLISGRKNIRCRPCHKGRLLFMEGKEGRSWLSERRLVERLQTRKPTSRRWKCDTFLFEPLPSRQSNCPGENRPQGTDQSKRPRERQPDAHRQKKRTTWTRLLKPKRTPRLPNHQDMVV